ncbi:MAG: hypothetical protein ACFFAS_12230 [Promethearchaeota archaeon]
MSNFGNDVIEIEDLENFIDGLKNSFDRLGDADPTKSQGFQSQIAKAISMLRLKKMAKIEPIPKFLGHFTTEDLKNFLLNQLEQAKLLLENEEFSNNRKKFGLVLKIAQLRENINNM